MAKTTNIYEERLKALKKTRESFKTPVSSSQSMANSISNYQTRLQNAGYNPSEVTDTRNFLEKALNLDEGQNVLFDIGELIDRPKQAIFGAIQSAQEGEDVLEGFKSGLKGEEEYYGGDILRNLGVSDKKLFTNPLTGEDVSLADIGGLGLDIFADPVDLIPGGMLVKAGKVAGATSDLNKANKALRVAKKTKDATRIADAAKNVDVAKDILKTVKDTKYNASLLEAGVQGLVGGTKRAVGGAVTRGAKALDTSSIKKLAEGTGLITKGTKVTEDMIPTLTKQLADIGVDFSSKTEALEGLGKAFKRTFKYGESMPNNLYNTVTRTDNTIDSAVAYGRKMANDVKTQATEYATKVGRETDDVSKDILTYISSKYRPEQGMDEYVKEALGKKGIKSNVIKMSSEESKALQESISNFREANKLSKNAIDVIVTPSGARITGNRNLLGAIHDDANLMEQLSNIKHATDLKLSNDIAKRVSELDNLYNSDKEFKVLVDNAESLFKDYDDMLVNATNGKISFKNMLREGYTPNTLTDAGKEVEKLLKDEKITGNVTHLNDAETFKGNKSTVSAKRMSNVGEEAEIQATNIRKETIARNKKGQETLKAQYFDNQKKTLEDNIKEIDTKLKELKVNADNNINKANLKYEDAKRLKESYNQQIDNISDVITKEVEKKATRVSNKKLVDTMASKTEKYVNKSNKVVELQTQLARKDLTDAQIKTLTTKLNKSLDAQINARAEMEFAVAQIKGAAEEKFIKNAGDVANKAAENMSDLTKKAIKQQGNVDNALDRIKKANESFESIKNDLITQQKDLRLQLQSLLSKNKTAHDAEITRLIGEKQKIIDVLESVEGKQLYSLDFFENFDDFMNKTANQARAMNAYNEIFLESGLRNSEVISFVGRGERAQNTAGKMLMDAKMQTKALDYLDSMKNFMPENSKALKEFKKMLKSSKEVWIDKGVADLITINSGVNNDIAKAVLDAADYVNGFFKKTSTVSPGTQMRNLIGNPTNMVLSGVNNPLDLAKAYKTAGKLRNTDYMVELITKSAKGTLSKTEAKEYKIVKQFIESGAMGKGKDIRDLEQLIEKAATSKESKNILRKTWDGVFSLSAKANQAVDNFNRLALLSHATDNTKYLNKIGAKDAIDAMHQVLFDPQNLSPFENKYIKRVIPFYTFTKQNLMFQMKNIVNNTSQYNRLFKTVNKTYDAVGEGNYKQYQKENFEIPIFNGDNGLYTLKANLPVSDLGEYMSNPMQRLVSSTSPLIKAPFELVSGKDTFTGQDLDASPLELLGKYTGIKAGGQDVLGSGKSIYNLATGEEDVNAATILPSLFRYTDPEKIANSNQYEELMAYQAYIKNLKSQGIEVPTMREINKSANSSLSRLKKMREKINKRR